MYSMRSMGRGFVDKAVGFNTDSFKFRPKPLLLFAARVKVHPDFLSVKFPLQYLIGIEMMWEKLHIDG